MTKYQKLMEKGDRCMTVARKAHSEEFRQLWHSIANRLYEMARRLTIEEAMQEC